MMKSDKINQQRELSRETDFLLSRFNVATQATVSIRRLKVLKRNLKIQNKHRVDLQVQRT